MIAPDAPRPRCRALAIGVVLLAFGALRALAPDPVARRDVMLLVLTSLGYGHVLGAVFSSRRPARRGAELACFAAGVVLLSSWLPTGGWLLALVLLAAWHVVENDLAMQGASARVPPLPVGLRPHLVAAVVVAAVLGLALATPLLPRPLLRLGVPAGWVVWNAEEVFAALLLYHVVAWSIFVWRPGARRRWLAAHALPVPIAVVLSLLWPEAWGRLADPLVYLVLSVAHALHTAARRGVAPSARWIFVPSR